MDSFKRKQCFLDNKIYNCFFWGTLIPTILAKSRGLKAVCGNQCTQVLGHLWTGVLSCGQFGKPSAAPKVWKKKKKSGLLLLTASEIFYCLCVLTHGIDSFKLIRVWWESIFRKHPNALRKDANESVIVTMNCCNTEKPL